MVYEQQAHFSGDMLRAFVLTLSPVAGRRPARGGARQWRRGVRGRGLDPRLEDRARQVGPWLRGSVAERNRRLPVHALGRDG